MPADTKTKAEVLAEGPGPKPCSGVATTGRKICDLLKNAVSSLTEQEGPAARAATHCASLLIVTRDPARCIDWCPVLMDRTRAGVCC